MSFNKSENLCFQMVVAILSITLSSSTYAELHPFYINNQNPFIQIFGLPRAETAIIAEPGHYIDISTLDIVNNTVQGETAGEKLVLDGETYRFNVALRYGVLKNTEVGFDIPLINHRPGRFDNFIRNWHDFFGLSNKEQEQFEPNQLNYYYHANGNTAIDIHDNAMGIGDLRLSAASSKVSVLSWLPESLIYRASLKLPTGDSKKLMGSGSVDASLSVSGQNNQALQEYYSEFAGQAGVLWLGNSDLFSAEQRNFVVFASSCIDWDYWKPLVFKAQLDYHSSFYKSDIGHLGKDSIQLTVGGAITISKNAHFDIGVSENLVTDSTPDIGLNLSLWLKL